MISSTAAPIFEPLPEVQEYYEATPVVGAVPTPAVTTPAMTTPAVNTTAVSAPAVCAPAVSAPAVSAPAVSAPAVSGIDEFPQSVQLALNSVVIPHFPSPFSDLKVTSVIVREGINSPNSYQFVLDMLAYGNSYISSGPIVGSDKIVCNVRSESDQSIRYKVCIAKKGPLSKKFKRGSYRNYIYSCECKSKKVSLLFINFSM